MRGLPERCVHVERLGIEFLSVFGLPPVDFVNLAADLGCVSIGTALGPGPIDPPLYAPFSLKDDLALRRDMLAAIRDRGISVSLGDGFVVAPDRDIRDSAEDLEIMAELGAPRVNTISFDPDVSRSTDQIGTLVEMAADAGLETTIESSPGFTPATFRPRSTSSVRLVGPISASSSTPCTSYTAARHQATSPPSTRTSSATSSSAMSRSLLSGPPITRKHSSTGWSQGTVNYRCSRSWPQCLETGSSAWKCPTAPRSKRACRRMNGSDKVSMRRRTSWPILTKLDRDARTLEQTHPPNLDVERNHKVLGLQSTPIALGPDVREASVARAIDPRWTNKQIRITRGT